MNQKGRLHCLLPEEAKEVWTQVILLERMLCQARGQAAYPGAAGEWEDARPYFQPSHYTGIWEGCSFAPLEVGEKWGGGGKRMGGGLLKGWEKVWLKTSF